MIRYDLLKRKHVFSLARSYGITQGMLKITAMYATQSSNMISAHVLQHKASDSARQRNHKRHIVHASHYLLRSARPRSSRNCTTASSCSPRTVGSRSSHRAWTRRACRRSRRRCRSGCPRGVRHASGRVCDLHRDRGRELRARLRRHYHAVGGEDDGADGGVANDPAIVLHDAARDLGKRGYDVHVGRALDDRRCGQRGARSACAHGAGEGVQEGLTGREGGEWGRGECAAHNAWADDPCGVS